LSTPGSEALFQSGLFDTLVILDYQLLSVSLTFSLVLMVNHRLEAELQQDIAERKRAEDEILRLNSSLEERVEERTGELQQAISALSALNQEMGETNAHLKEATRAKSEFLASMSHELRTPLNSIIGFSGIMLQGFAGELSPEQARQLGMIKHSGLHLLSLVNEVLDLAKVESGQNQPALVTYDVGEHMRTAGETVRPMAESKGVELRLAIPDDLTSIRTDGLYVDQIVLNLLGNAVKFTDEGHVGITVVQDESGVTIAIEDSGAGITEEHQERIFEDFYQVVPHHRAEHEGTGLGLALSRRLAELIGAHIEVASEIGHGSTFTVRVPDLRE